MTTPGGWSPTSGYMLPAGVGAAGGTGLSGFAGTTEADWRAWIESQHAPHWDGLGDPIEVMKALVNAVVSALKGNFQPFIDLIGEVPILGDIVKGAANFLSGGRLINLGQLTAAPVNLIAGGFDSLDSVAEAEGWSWDPSDGYGSPGCAMRTLDGEPGLLFSPVAAEVEEGKTYDASCRMKGVDVYPSGASVRFYDADHQHIGTAGLAAVEGLSPGWCLIAASDIPAPTGARWAYFVLEDHGSVGPGELRWDDAGIWAVQETLPQRIVDGLLDKFDEIGDDIEGAVLWVKSLIEKLTGRAWSTLADAISGAEAFAAQLKTILGGGVVSSPLPTLIGALNIGSMQSTLNQFQDIFMGVVVTPINGIVAAVKDWWDQWFGGGSSNAIPLSQKGAAGGVASLDSAKKVPVAQVPSIPTSLLTVDTAGNPPTLDAGGKIRGAQLPDFSASYLAVGTRGAAGGVAPLNGDAVVPLANLPEEVGGMGGSGFGLPYMELVLASTKTFGTGATNRVEAGLASDWSITGTASLGWGQYTVVGGTVKYGFTLPIPGMWSISISAVVDHPSIEAVSSLYRQCVGGIGHVVACGSWSNRTGYESSSTVVRVGNFTIGGLTFSSSDVFQPDFGRVGTSANSLVGINGASGQMTRICCTYLGAA